MQSSGWNCQSWPSRSQNWMFVHSIIILSRSRQFPTSSSQNRRIGRVGDWPFHALAIHLKHQYRRDITPCMMSHLWKHCFPAETQRNNVIISVGNSHQSLICQLWRRTGNFCWFLFNFTFMIWDSRHEDWQLLWLSFKHWHYVRTMSRRHFHMIMT